MNNFLLFTTLLWFGIQTRVNSTGFLSNFYDKKMWIFGDTGPAPDNYPVVLAVEKSGRVYLANNRFVTNQMNDIYSKFLFACSPDPESTRQDLLKILYRNSTFHKELYIAKTYNRPLFPGSKLKFIEHKCKRSWPLKLSTVYVGPYEGNDDIDLYMIGYEIYLGEDIKSYKIESFNRVPLKDSRFAWFNAYSIAFDRKRGNVVNVFSPMMAYQKNYQPNTVSEIASTSREAPNVPKHYQYYFEENPFFSWNYSTVKFYEEENKKNVFRNLFGDSASLNYFDPMQDRYFGEIHLAPPSAFGTLGLKLDALTLGNMASMWNLVYYNAWVNLETHIEYLAQGLKAIHVITGTYETLKLSGAKIYLMDKNRVRMPAAFFKLVSYSPNENEKYNMLIVTSNNPYEKEDRINSSICLQNQCKRFGWEYVQQDYHGMGRTSCCELTKENLRELKLGHMEQLMDKPLDLKQVPHWRVDNLTLDLKTYILNQINDRELDKPADDEIYRSDETVQVDYQDDEVTYSNFISIMYSNYMQIYLSENMESSSSQL